MRYGPGPRPLGLRGRAPRHVVHRAAGRGAAPARAARAPLDNAATSLPAYDGRAPRHTARPLPHARAGGAPRPGPPDPWPEHPEVPAPKSPSAKPSARPSTTARPTGTTLRIGSWSARIVRGGQEAVDACRDAVQWTGPDLGTEDGYAMRTAVVVGHDFCGFGQLATLAIGTVVTVETRREVLRYRVYARHLTPGRGAPAHGLYWGDLTLQSCVGPDTGFTYLERL